MTFVSVATFSCIDDKGSYRYGDLDDMMPVSITKFTDLGYIPMEKKLGESINVIPEVTGTEDGNYTYLWFAGKAPADLNDTITLSNEFELNLTLDEESGLEVGTYDIYFEVWDPLHGYVKRTAPLTLRVLPLESVLGTGWFVLKDMGDGTTDFDFYGETLKSNVLTSLMMERPEGEPVSIHWMPHYGYDRTVVDEVTGKISTVNENYSYANTYNPSAWTVKGRVGALILSTTRDLISYNLENMEFIKDYDEQFFAPPAGDRNIQNVRTIPWKLTGTYDWASSMGDGDAWMIRNGKVHSLLISRAAAGNRFVGERFLKNGTTNYNLHPSFAKTWNRAGLFFDLESHSFLHLAGDAAAALTEFPPADAPQSSWWTPGAEPLPGMPTLSNMDYDLVVMADDRLHVQDVSGTAALLKGNKPDNQDQYLLLMGTSANPGVTSRGTFYANNVYPFTSQHLVPTDGSTNITKTNRIYLPGRNSSVIWFTHQNAVYQYNFADEVVGPRDVPIITLPDGEEIVYMFQCYRNIASGEAGYPASAYASWAFMTAILSNDDSSWHIRVYKTGYVDTAAANSYVPKLISTTPEIEISGEGKAKHMAWNTLNYSQIF